MSFRPSVLALTAALAFAGCDSRAEVTAADPSEAPSTPEEQPPRTRPPESAPAGPTRADPGAPTPTPTRSVVRSVEDSYMALHAGLPSRTWTIEGPWEVEGVVREPGDEVVEALGRRLTGCRTTALSEHSRATWCPDVGVVFHALPGRFGGPSEENLVAIRRGSETWASSPCDVIHLTSDEERAALCGRRLRSMGPAGGRGDANGCIWRYVVDGPHPTQPRHAAVALRLEAVDAAATDDRGPSGPYRRWSAQGPRWSVTVSSRRDECGGDVEGSAFADRLLELAPR